MKDSSIAIGESSEIIEQSFSNVTSLSMQNSNGISEISHGLSDISDSLTELSEMGNKNLDNMSVLENEVSRFKI